MWPFRHKEPRERQAIHELRQAIKELEEGLAALQDKHERLRGRFYASRGAEPPAQPEGKAEILRRMGFLGRQGGQ